MNLGYACINMELSSKKNKITSNRGMIKRTFKQKGLPYASQLALQNCKDLVSIIEWNNANGFSCFRISSCLFPWSSEYELEDLPDIEEISQYLKKAGKTARDAGQRLSFHPGPFNILTSSKEHVVKNTIKDLTTHGEIFDIMEMPRTRFAKINIHIGASYGDRESAMERWLKNYEMLPDSVKTRLTVENDDKESLFTTAHLYNGICKHSNVPIVFDYHHHRCHNEGVPEKEAFEMAISTWGDIKPTLHYSESAQREKGEGVQFRAHSDYIYDMINPYGREIDIVVEAKAKEKAVLKYWSKYGKRNELVNS
jgi:UV DNA damage endonuclease